MKRFKPAAELLALLMFWSTTALAAYPDRPIHVIVPFAPGGGADPVGNSPDQFGAFIKAEKERLGDLIRRAKVPMR